MEATQFIPCTQDLAGDFDHEEEDRLPVVGWLEIDEIKYDLLLGPNKIGRDPATCSVVLSNCAGVSKVHAVLEVQSDGATLMDFGSRNKTKIDNLIMRPNVCYAIRGGELFKFGNVLAKYFVKEVPDNDLNISDSDNISDVSESILMTASPDDPISMLTSPVSSTEVTDGNAATDERGQETIVTSQNANAALQEPSHSHDPAKGNETYEKDPDEKLGLNDENPELSSNHLINVKWPPEVKNHPSNSDTITCTSSSTKVDNSFDVSYTLENKPNINFKHSNSSSRPNNNLNSSFTRKCFFMPTQTSETNIPESDEEDDDDGDDFDDSIISPTPRPAVSSTLFQSSCTANISSTSLCPKMQFTPMTGGSVTVVPETPFPGGSALTPHSTGPASTLCPILVPDSQSTPLPPQGKAQALLQSPMRHKRENLSSSLLFSSYTGSEGSGNNASENIENYNSDVSTDVEDGEEAEGRTGQALRQDEVSEQPTQMLHQRNVRKTDKQDDNLFELPTQLLSDEVHSKSPQTAESLRKPLLLNSEVSGNVASTQDILKAFGEDSSGSNESSSFIGDETQDILSAFKDTQQVFPDEIVSTVFKVPFTTPSRIVKKAVANERSKDNSKDVSCADLYDQPTQLLVLEQPPDDGCGDDDEMPTQLLINDPNDEDSGDDVSTAPTQPFNTEVLPLNDMPTRLFPVNKNSSTQQFDESISDMCTQPFNSDEICSNSPGTINVVAPVSSSPGGRKTFFLPSNKRVLETSSALLSNFDDSVGDLPTQSYTEDLVINNQEANKKSPCNSDLLKNKLDDSVSDLLTQPYTADLKSRQGLNESVSDLPTQPYTADLKSRQGLNESVSDLPTQPYTADLKSRQGLNESVSDLPTQPYTADLKSRQGLNESVSDLPTQPYTADLKSRQGLNESVSDLPTQPYTADLKSRQGLNESVSDLPTQPYTADLRSMRELNESVSDLPTQPYAADLKSRRRLDESVSDLPTQPYTADLKSRRRLNESVSDLPTQPYAADLKSSRGLDESVRAPENVRDELDESVSDILTQPYTADIQRKSNQIDGISRLDEHPNEDHAASVSVTRTGEGHKLQPVENVNCIVTKLRSDSSVDIRGCHFECDDENVSAAPTQPFRQDLEDNCSETDDDEDATQLLDFVHLNRSAVTVAEAPAEYEKQEIEKENVAEEDSDPPTPTLIPKYSYTKTEELNTHNRQDSCNTAQDSDPPTPTLISNYDLATLELNDHTEVCATTGYANDQHGRCFSPVLDLTPSLNPTKNTVSSACEALLSSDANGIEIQDEHAGDDSNASGVSDSLMVDCQLKVLMDVEEPIEEKTSTEKDSAQKLASTENNEKGEESESIDTNYNCDVSTDDESDYETEPLTKKTTDSAVACTNVSIISNNPSASESVLGKKVHSESLVVTEGGAASITERVAAPEQNDTAIATNKGSIAAGSAVYLGYSNFEGFKGDSDSDMEDISCGNITFVSDSDGCPEGSKLNTPIRSAVAAVPATPVPPSFTTTLNPASVASPQSTSLARRSQRQSLSRKIDFKSQTLKKQINALLAGSSDESDGDPTDTPVLFSMSMNIIPEVPSQKVAEHPSPIRCSKDRSILNRELVASSFKRNPFNNKNSTPVKAQQYSSQGDTSVIDLDTSSGPVVIEEKSDIANSGVCDSLNASVELVAVVNTRRQRAKKLISSVISNRKGDTGISVASSSIHSSKISVENILVNTRSSRRNSSAVRSNSTRNNKAASSAVIKSSRKQSIVQNNKQVKKCTSVICIDVPESSRSETDTVANIDLSTVVTNLKKSKNRAIIDETLVNTELNAEGVTDRSTTESADAAALTATSLKVSDVPKRSNIESSLNIEKTSKDVTSAESSETKMSSTGLAADRSALTLLGTRRGKRLILQATKNKKNEQDIPALDRSSVLLPLTKSDELPSPSLHSSLHSLDSQSDNQQLPLQHNPSDEISSNLTVSCSAVTVPSRQSLSVYSRAGGVSSVNACTTRSGRTRRRPSRYSHDSDEELGRTGSRASSVHNSEDGGKCSDAVLDEEKVLTLTIKRPRGRPSKSATVLSDANNENSVSQNRRSGKRGRTSGGAIINITSESLEVRGIDTSNCHGSVIKVPVEEEVFFDARNTKNNDTSSVSSHSSRISTSLRTRASLATSAPAAELQSASTRASRRIGGRSCITASTVESTPVAILTTTRRGRGRGRERSSMVNLRSASALPRVSEETAQAINHAEVATHLPTGALESIADAGTVGIGSRQCSRVSTRKRTSDEVQSTQERVSQATNSKRTKKVLTKTESNIDKLKKAPSSSATPLSVLSHSSSMNQACPPSPVPAQDLNSSTASVESFASSVGDARRRLSRHYSAELASLTPDSSSRAGRGAARHRVLFTGIVPDSDDLRTLARMGGVVVEAASLCSVLVASCCKRTCKLLACVARGVPVVRPSWLAACAAAGGFTDPWQFIVQDADVERRYGFSLRRSLERGRKRGLFTGLSIHATQGVRPDQDQMRELVESGGGTYLSTPPRTHEPHVVVVSCPEDRRRWPEFSRLRISVVSTEFILTGILRAEAAVQQHLLC